MSFFNTEEEDCGQLYPAITAYEGTYRITMISPIGEHG
jgi:hypothetical protein